MAEKILNVYQRLAEVRKAVPYLKKEQQGKQYNYVGSSDVLGSLHEKNQRSRPDVGSGSSRSSLDDVRAHERKRDAFK